MNFELKSSHLRKFIKEIQFHNRNPKAEDIKALSLLEDISTNPERVILPGSELFRSRIITKNSEINKTAGFYGFDEKGSFVPPSEATRDMRANYRYIPYLYCANNPYLALVEVRPRLGAKVSIATIIVREKLRLLDFTMTKKPNRMSEAKQNLFSDLSKLYSVPVTDDDDILDYIPTQFIAEYAKYLEYDGIMYSSSLTPELVEAELDFYNIVVFKYNKCKAVKSNVVEITGNTLECKQIDSSEQELIIKNYIEMQLDEIGELIGGI